MTTADDTSPDLVLFSAYPPGWLEQPPLPGALQAFETSLLAIALGRYHTALVLCVSAIEAALKAHLRIPLPTAESPNVPDRYLPSLWKEVAAQHCRLAVFTKPQIEQLKNKRNRMAHYGHAPADNSACAELLLDVGYPLFAATLADCFNFDLDGLGLKRDAAPHWRKAFELRRRTQGTTVTAQLCFTGLAHFLRHFISPTFISDQQLAVSARSFEAGADFDFQHKRLSRLETEFSHYWLTDCSCCREVQCLALDLSFPNRGFEVGVKRAMCVHCDLFVPDVGPLASILFAEQVTADLHRIIQEHDLAE